jgi:hypothetical protein
MEDIKCRSVSCYKCSPHSCHILWSICYFSNCESS